MNALETIIMSVIIAVGLTVLLLSCEGIEPEWHDEVNERIATLEAANTQELAQTPTPPSGRRMKLITLFDGTEVSVEVLRKLSRKELKELGLGWPGRCQQCFASLDPPDSTWCRSCGISDEDDR